MNEIRRKIFTGNGCHRALAKFQGIIIYPSGNEEGQKNKILLPEGEFDCSFVPKLYWLFCNHRHEFEGIKNYIGYPKISDGKLVKIELAVLQKEDQYQQETWEVCGMWSGKKKKLLVQRDVKIIPEDTSLHFYQYSFVNQEDFQKNLWDKYCYLIMCKREKDELAIKKTVPIACPVKKPQPPRKYQKTELNTERQPNVSKEKPSLQRKPKA
ncbi:MAG: hypothetical protein DSM107014_04855 [Gomphosphaeria aponina SAG 52.96 = DSM 107014]|uniref:Uncharacterized protein n=1 Tax=Gomphosphaeria aponina SAG 52.96 = DSM 107014 TaxID=1521640 RepID=A0A941GPK9_9CHRO|nr:hypothetical protein [Gomphosphaeria aponina SAG 52.96 = DSM 107014]